MLTIIGGVTPTKVERVFIYVVDLAVAVAIVAMTVVAVYQVNMGMI